MALTTAEKLARARLRTDEKQKAAAVGKRDAATAGGPSAEAKLEAWQFAHQIQAGRDIPLLPIDPDIGPLDIMTALFESLSVAMPTKPSGKTDGDFIAYLKGFLEAALGVDVPGRADYLEKMEGGSSGRRMRTDSSSGDAQRVAYAQRIESRGGSRGRRASASNLGATGGGAELRTDSVELNWQQGPDGRRWVNLNDLHPGVISTPATPMPTAPRTDEANPAAAGDSVQPAASVQRIEGRGSGRKRKPKFHHS